MAAVWYRLRAELRDRWRGLVASATPALTNLAAVLPARLASRLRPAAVLRSE